MKRILCTTIALLMLLTACSAPIQGPEPSAEQEVNATHGVYELSFTVERLSGWQFGDWDVVYTYNGETVTSGYRITCSPDVFLFRSIQVDVIEKDAPNNIYSATFPVAICDGGSGKTELTVTDRDGRTATFMVTCQVTLVGKR